MPQLALETFKLSNGMRVIAHRQGAVHRASIMLNIGSGCVDESAWGTAHMLEHLMFRGTKRYPSFGAVSEAFECIGADFNAFTARETTSFDISMPRESVAEALALLGDVMMHAKLTGIVGERDIIREEILSDYDDDNALINADDLLTSLFYGDAGHPIAGNPEDIEKITAKDVRAFYEAHYAADNMLLVCTGAIPPTEALQEMAEKALGRIAPQSRRSARRKMPEIYRLQAPAPDPLIHVKDYDGATQSDVSLGFLFPGPRSPQLAALEILVRILDDGMASRLSRKLVEELAIVYDIEAYLSTALDTTLLQIRTSCRHKRVAKVIDAVYGILSDIAQNGVADDELARVRKRVIWEHEELCDGIARLSQWISAMAMQGMSCDIEARCKALCAVTDGEIRQIAKEAMETRPHIAAIVGEMTDKRAYDLKSRAESRLCRPVRLTIDRSPDDDGE